MALNFIEKGKERRSFERKNVYASVRYQSRTSRNYGSTLTRDISEGGLRLSFDRFVPLNTDLILQMNLPTVPEVVSAIGTVVWSHRIPHSDRYQLGIRFQEISEKQRSEVSDWLRRFIGKAT